MLTQSQQASTKTNKATEFETIQLAVAGSFNDEGNLDLAILVNNLRNEMPSDTQVTATKDNENNDIFPVIVSAKYGMYEIDENGKAENTSGVSLNETDLKIFAGSEVTLTATVSSDLAGKTVSWSTGSSSVASISAETGESITVTAGASGSTTITAQVEGGDKVGTCTISVVQAVSSITLDNTTLEIEQGGTGTLTATVSPATNVEDIEFIIDGNANQAGAYFGTAGTLTKTISVGADGKATVEVNVPEDSSYIDKTTTIRVQGKNTGNVSGKVGTITVKVIKEMTKADRINARIGDDVSYSVTITNSDSTTTTIDQWQILYADDYDDMNDSTGEVFIISKDILETNNSLNSYRSGSYNLGYLRENIYSQKWNSKWLEECSELEDDTVSNSIRCVGFLCNEEKWEKYCNGVANYCVGGPTLELLMKSYDVKNGTNYYASLTCDEYGYNSFTVPSEYQSSGSNNFPRWWLSSTSCGQNLYGNLYDWCIWGCGVYGLSRYSVTTNLWGISYSTGFRPVVSVPIDKLNENTLMILED